MHGLPGQCIQIENEKTQLSRWQTQMTVHMKKTAHILTDLKEKLEKNCHEVSYHERERKLENRKLEKNRRRMTAPRMCAESLKKRVRHCRHGFPCPRYTDGIGRKKKRQINKWTEQEFAFKKTMSAMTTAEEETSSQVQHRTIDWGHEDPQSEQTKVTGRRGGRKTKEHEEKT